MTNWMKKILATLCALALLLSCAVAEGLNEEAELPAASEIEVEEIELTPEEAAALQKTGSQADEPAEHPAEEKTEDGQPEEQAEGELPEEQPQAAEPAEDLQNEEQEEIIVSEIKTLSDEIASLAEEQQEEISAEEAPAEGIIPAEELADDPEAEPAQEEIILNLKQDAPHQIKGKVSSNKPYTVKATDGYSRTVLFTLTVPTENSITVTLDDKALTLTKIDTEESIQYTFTCKLVKEEVTSFILIADEGTVPFTLTISKIGTTEEAPEEKTKEEGPTEEITEEKSAEEIQNAEKPVEEATETEPAKEVQEEETEEPEEKTPKTEEPQEKPTEESEEEPVEGNNEQTEEEPKEELTEEGEDELQEEPAEKPIEEDIGQPEEEPVEERKGETQKNPVGEPTEDDVEQPEEKTEENREEPEKNTGESTGEESDTIHEEIVQEPENQTEINKAERDINRETVLPDPENISETTGEQSTGEQTEVENEESIKELPEDRNAVITISWDDENPTYGSVAHFKATLSGYEGFDYEVQWQWSQDGINWMDVENATSENLDVIYTKENGAYQWRILVETIPSTEK